ncbi:MAG: Gfo/Idh/MocA family oxidoreductase [Treponema sp.]|jgi:predicted dehydrogenase|nr:Gfo/Idh/MocA family oxidoreductase [Treponema sp.]
MKKYNVGLIGAGFMGKAHSLAYAGMPMFFWPAPGIPVRKIMCDVSDELAKDAAARFGFEKYTSKWQDLVNDPEIDVVDISTPNNTHAEIAIAAAKAGKHILCEKPIATTTADAFAMVEAVEKAGIKNQLAFNYRRVPAVVFAKKLIDEGVLGRIFTYRGTYFSGGDTKGGMGWRQLRSVAGYGSLGDIGTHSIDVARYLIGDFEAVNGLLRTFVPERPFGPKQEMHKVENDDEASFSIQFKNGAIGSIEAGGNSWGRNNQIAFEIYGEKGAILFDYEHRDELRVAFGDDPVDRRGFRTISTGGPAHPYGNGLWPIDGIGIGYGELKIIECYDFFKAIAENKEATPNFRAGYEISLICDAIAQSSETGKWIEIK